MHGSANSRVSSSLQAAVVGALYAARLVEPLLERSPTAVPWRERPPEIAGWPAKSAASDVVAHATAERVLATRASSVSPVEAGVNSTWRLQEKLHGFIEALFTLVSACERLTPRGGPRQNVVFVSKTKF